MHPAMRMLLLLFTVLLQLPPVSCWHITGLRLYPRDLHPTRISQEITVNGAAAAKGYVVFASVDKQRPLGLVCAWRDCKIYTEKVSRNPHTGDVHYIVNVQVGLVRLEYAGSLMVCTGPKDLFRKTPLIHIDRDVHCKGGNLLLTHYEDLCTSSVDMYTERKTPEDQLTEEFYPVAAYTWFMTEENYQELREGNKTEVFVPLFTNSYKLPFVFGFCWHLSTQRAFLQTPSSGKFRPTTLGYFLGLTSHSPTSKCRVFTLDIDAAVENSGDYVVEFRGSVLYTPYYSVQAYGSFTQNQVKTVTISFFRGPKITIAGHKDHRVVFSPGETSGTFTVDVYTTSQLVAFRVQRSDGDPQGQQMLTEFVSYPSNSIVAKYRIGIPWMTEKLNGIYTISVTNNDGESATQTVKIEKAAALEILVSPKQQIVGEATPVSYECLVVGHPVSSISWARDFETLSPDKYNIQTGVFGEDGKGLRLTFLSPRLNDSGVYVCSTSNQFETVQNTVDLAVFPPGSPYIDPTYEAEVTGVSALNGTTDSNYTLTTGNDLEEYGGGPRKTYTIVAVVLVALVAVAVLVMIVAVAICTKRLCRRRQQSRMKSVKSQARPEQRKLLRQESRFQLVADTFRSETEVEMVKEWLNSEDCHSHGDEGVEQRTVGPESNNGDLEALEPKEHMKFKTMDQTDVVDSGNLEEVVPCAGKSGGSKARRGGSMKKKKKKDTRGRDKTSTRGNKAS